jgi:hypothetical protein
VNVTEPVTTIAVDCNNSGHARGKIAKIDTFQKVGETWFTIEQLGDRKPRQHGWRANRAPWGAPRHGYWCKLCELQLRCSHERLQWALNMIAAQGESKISFKVLIDIAS